MNFICLIDDDTAQETLINTNHVKKISEYSEINEETTVKKYVKGFCTFYMLDGTEIHLRIDFQKLKEIFKTERKINDQ